MSLKKKINELEEKHYEVSMSIALQAIRIKEMQKSLNEMVDSIFIIEAELDKAINELEGRGLN